MGLWVLINYSIALEENKEVFFEQKDVKLVMGECSISAELEKMLGTMLNKEVSIFKINSELLKFTDENLSVQLPDENKPLLVTIEILDMDPERPYWEMNEEDQLEAALKRKNEGNVLFSQQKYKLAISRYNVS